MSLNIVSTLQNVRLNHIWVILLLTCKVYAKIDSLGSWYIITLR